MDKKIAVFPGSFDPITTGHENIILRALNLFDEIVVGIGFNSSKNYFYSQEKRENFIRKVFEDESRIKVEHYSGLTIDFCKHVNAKFILRGLRTSADFEFERAIAQMNHAMNHNIETIFLISEPSFTHISSTIVRDILLNQGDITQFVPKGMVII
jgi:pantetheine-phosphate adenylyltransferase